MRFLSRIVSLPADRQVVKSRKIPARRGGLLLFSPWPEKRRLHKEIGMFNFIPIFLIQSLNYLTITICLVSAAAPLT
jgi:hypothetical protein